LFPAAVARHVPLPLRLIMGYGFAEHGFAKLLRGSDNFAGLCMPWDAVSPIFSVDGLPGDRTTPD
jgi:uncharacterized membrane protein YphA (DoxX/SURF4 family)